MDGVNRLAHLRNVPEVAIVLDVPYEPRPLGNCDVLRPHYAYRHQYARGHLSPPPLQGDHCERT